MDANKIKNDEHTHLEIHLFVCVNLRQFAAKAFAANERKWARLKSKMVDQPFKLDLTFTKIDQ